MQTPRVALIVDNPFRDLPGLVLLGLKLCSEGVTTMLVPNNIQRLELWRLVPSFVLHANLQGKRQELYDKILSTGAGLGVLDTEAFLRDKPSKMQHLLVQDKQIRSALGVYCCWGPVQAHSLVENGLFRENQVNVTGCPRMDFYSPQWANAALQLSRYAKPYEKSLILLNSAFTFANPGYRTKETKVNTWVRDWGTTEEEARHQQRQMEVALKQFVSLANRLAHRFPQATIVYRPHPFEGMELYKRLLEPLPNLKCIREGTVDGWILRAKAVIQRGCTTAFESNIAGVPSLAPGWIDVNWNPSNSDNASRVCANEEELSNALSEILDGGFRDRASECTNVDAVISDRFFKVDGYSYQRVARAVLSNLSEQTMRTRERECRKIDGSTNLKARLQQWSRRQRAAMRERCGLRPRQNVLYRRQQEVLKWDKSLKQFDTAKVKKIVQAIQGCEESRVDGLDGRMSIQSASQARSYRFGDQEGRTVVLAPAA